MKTSSIKYVAKSLLPVVCLTMLLCGCTKDFDYINSDPTRVPVEDLNKDNLWASYIQSMTQSIFAEDPNGYQQMDDLHGNIYSGYAGQANTWSPQNSLHYYFGISPGWHNMAFSVAYGSYEHIDYPVPGVMNSWNALRQRVDSTSITFAVGEVLKVTGMHRVTDMYGPIPYTQFGKTMNAPYDSQQTVYMTFFGELDHAIGIMTEYYTQSPAARPLVKFDMLYGSDILKWVRYANSLKLRLAMRIRYVDPVLAQKFAEEAVSHPLGVIEDISGTAAIVRNSIYPYTNPLYRLWNTYGESRMGANMDSFMNGYADPRRPMYFNTSPGYGGYVGTRYGPALNVANYGRCSSPNINQDSPLYIMTAAEVYFLRAEGALQGWGGMGTASDLYNKGIETAMLQWGVTGLAVTNYINNAIAKPAAYTDRVSTAYSIALTNPLLSTITIKWNETSSDDEKLERLMTQKWLAMYPNGQEAWSEFRRTGYPKVFLPIQNKSNGAVPAGEHIKRLPLPATEYANNSELVAKAVAELLGGNDSPGQRLWWDARTN